MRRTRLKTKGDIAFQSVAPRLWNSLALQLRLADTAKTINSYKLFYLIRPSANILLLFVFTLNFVFNMFLCLYCVVIVVQHIVIVMSVICTMNKLLLLLN